MNNEKFPRQLSKVKVTVSSNLNSIRPFLKMTKSIELSELTFSTISTISDSVFAAHFTALLSINYKFQPKTAAFILKSDHSFFQAWKAQTLCSNIVLNSGPILQKSISTSTLSILVEVLIKNKPYYLKTNLGLIKTRLHVLSATPRFEFET